MAQRIGVDVGGTFTDVVRLDLDTGALASAKVATDYGDAVNGILAGKALVDGGAACEALHHATTLATNALLQNKLPRAALLTTAGFRDVLDIGRIQRPAEGIYDFNIDTPRPLIPRALRLEVSERIGADGDVVAPLDEAALRETLRALRAGTVEAIAVCGLFAFVNPAHERRIAEIVAEELPGVPVSLSSVVSPEIREFERSSTTVIDAVLKPLVSPYLAELRDRAAAAGVGSVRIMMASGGLTSPDLAAAKPVAVVNSGPSAGVLAAASLGRATGHRSLITIDMGGTSLDIGVVERGRPVPRYEGGIAGYPMRMPMIDVAAVAAGGGSIAQVDDVGYVQVARESAGSEPGPACYGRGGARPTITDADVVLGRLGASLGGAGGFDLRPDRARRALQKEIAEPLGIDAEEAATAVLGIIQARMVKAIAANTLEKGLDVRGLPLVVYGGAGPTHGVELADAMGMGRAIIPYLAGSFSAIGLVLCPLRWDVSRMLLRPAGAVTASDLAGMLRALDREARAKLAATGADTATLSTHWLAHMRYAGQSYDLGVDPEQAFQGELDSNIINKLIGLFQVLHERFYAYRSADEVVEIVQLRLSVVGPETDFPRPGRLPEEPPAPLGARRVYFTQSGDWRDATLWRRPDLPPGHRVPGPAVVEGEGSSCLVPPGWRAEVDGWLNLVVVRED